MRKRTATNGANSKWGALGHQAASRTRAVAVKSFGREKNGLGLGRNARAQPERLGRGLMGGQPPQINRQVPGDGHDRSAALARSRQAGL